MPQAIAEMLRHVGPDASFPSGDAATAVAFAWPLRSALAHRLLSSSVSNGVPALCVALACFGRVYFHAHFIGDVIAGVACTIAAEGLLSIFVGIAVTDTQWWHFAIAHVLFVLLALSSRSKQQ